MNNIKNNVFQLSRSKTTFMKASCTNNIHTAETFLQLLLLKVFQSFFLRENKTKLAYFEYL